MNFRKGDAEHGRDVYKRQGHTGVLVPTKNHKYLFIEKLSFQLPYQVTRFESKEQLNDYLMGMYDTEWGQDTACLLYTSWKVKCLTVSSQW